MINRVLSSSYDHIVLDAPIRAKSGKVPDTFPSIQSTMDQDRAYHHPEGGKFC